jgi:hypothetical protein
MGTNLYGRVARVIERLPQDEREAARIEYLSKPNGRTLGTLDYLSFSVTHPIPSARHLGIDALLFFGKSGVERITLDYFRATRQGRSN